MPQPQRLGGHDRRRRSGLAPPGEDVEDDVGGVDAFAQRLGAGGLDRRQAVAQHGGEDLDHLPVAVAAPPSLRRTRSSARRQHPVLERRAVAQRAGLAGQHRHVVPGIEDGLVAAEGAGMLADDPPVLAQLDPIGIGADLDRAADRAGRDRVLVVVEAHEAGLRHRGRHGVEAVEGPGIGHEARPLGLEHLPDRPVAHLGMRMRLGVGDAAIEQPGVQLLVAPHPQPRREEALAHQPDLVLDLPLLPARAGCRRPDRPGSAAGVQATGSTR